MSEWSVMSNIHNNFSPNFKSRLQKYVGNNFFSLLPILERNFESQFIHRASNKFKKCILKSSKSVESLNGPNGIFLKLYDVIYHIGPHSGDEPKIGNFSIYPLFHFLIFLWNEANVGKWKNCQFLAHLPSGVQYDR